MVLGTLYTWNLTTVLMEHISSCTGVHAFFLFRCFWYYCEFIMVWLENPGLFTFHPRFFAVTAVRNKKSWFPVISRKNFRKSAVTYIPVKYWIGWGLLRRCSYPNILVFPSSSLATYRALWCITRTCLVVVYAPGNTLGVRRRAREENWLNSWRQWQLAAGRVEVVLFPLWRLDLVDPM